jgi:L-amino acid N-acyltransferase YncA
MHDRDGPVVLATYQAGMDGGNATFETQAPSWEAFKAKVRDDLRLVALDDGGSVLGWSAAGTVSDRGVYVGVAEHSVYVDPNAQGRGVGACLLNALIERSEAAGVWTLQSGIFPENQASLALHERCGFRVVGVRQRVGSHFGRWRDVVMVERRSVVVGV